MTVKMSLEIQARVREMADSADTFPADVIALAAVRLYEDWQAGQVDFYDYQIPSDHPRRPWRLEIPEL